MIHQIGRIMRGRITLMVLVMCSPLLAFSQNLAQHNWYFGNSDKGIRFNRADNSPMLVTNKANPFGTGGSAVATDPATANLFFYTDGSNVYDATHALMTNGSGLNANTSANQPVAVCAIPGKANMYYIFTNSANFTAGGTISVSVVDMTAFGNSTFPSPPLGAVTTKNTAVPGLPLRSEGMAIVPHANGKDFWLITQQVNTTTYSATLIDAGTFTGTFNTTNVTLGNAITVANFAYNKKLKKFAVSAQTANTDALILTFNNDATVPILAIDQVIANSGTSTTGNESIYDMEWDAAGQYLYISRTGDTGIPADLLQFDYLNPTTSLSTVLKTPVFRSYGLQVAPDSAIYFLYQATAGGSFLVDRFTKTDTIAGSIIRTPTPFGAGTNFNGTQFPSFLPKAKVNLTVDFTFNNKPNCQNNPTTFYPNVSPNADSLNWKFGDSQDTTTWSPIHVYQNGGTFNVTLTAYYQGQQKDTTKAIVITPFKLQLTLVQDTTACQCQLPARKKLGGPCALPDFSVTVKVKGGTGSETYLWSNGNTTKTLFPDSAGYYYVVVTDPSTKCATYAGVNVKEFKLQDQRQNIWYFGNNAGIDFNINPPKPLSGSNMDAPEGCAIVCDRNGQTIFYTDGSNVYNKNNVLIDTGIGGDPQSSQSSLIIPVTGDETLYYIFTTQAIDGLSLNAMRYSLYDLKKDSVVKKNVLLFTKSTESITGNDKWMIAHEYGNNTFRAYPVSIKGIGDPVYSAIGSDHSFASKENGQGYMKLGPNNKLAVALSTPGSSNLVEVFDFNDTTGMVTNYRKIDLKTTAGQVYGIEFSSGGNKLFASVDGLPKPSFVYEYAFDTLGIPYLKNKSAAINEELGAIQIAPNGQIYVAVNGATSLGLIAAVDDTTQVSPFILSGFALAAGTNSNLGLPNFRQQISNAFGGPAFTFNTPCIGDTTHFVGTPRDPIDLFDWSFGDGGSSTEASPAHLYQNPGEYTVVMKLHNRCPNSLDSSVQKITVYPKPPKPTLPASSVLCNGPVVLDANTAGLPGTTYYWSTGDTTRMITVKNQTSSLSVTNTDIHGCQSTAQGGVGDVRPKVNFGPDQTLCQGSASPVLKAGFGTTYTWTVPAGVGASTTSSQQVDLSSPFTVLAPQTYSVVVSIIIDPVTTCSNADTITYTVKPMPTFTFTGINPSGACGTPTGSTILTLTGPENVLYSYDILGPGSAVPSGIDQPVNGVPINNPAQAGVYTAIVVNQVSLCQAQNQVSLSDQTVNVTATTPLSTCSTIAINANTNVSTPFQYQVTDGTGAVVDTNPSVSTAAFATKPLPAGNYILQVTGGTCVATTNVVINPANPDVPFSLVADVCGTPNQTITASPAAGPTYAWDPGTGIVSGAGTNVLVINPGAGGPYTYSVTASQAGFCPTSQSITVNIPPAIAPSFVQGDACADQVMLTASPSGNYSYRWFLQDTGGAFNFVAAGQMILVNESGTYELQIADPVAGCTVTSAPKAVTVSGILTAGITVTQACADGKPFTLTATSNQTVTYKWYLNNVLIPGASAATLDQTPEGTYKVEVTTGTCTTPAEINVKRQPVPSGQLPDNAIICDDPDNHDPSTSKVNLDPGSFITYNWFRDNLALGYTDEIYTAESAGTYSVDLKNIYGCTASDRTIVINNCEPIVTAPNAFRPSSSVISNEQFKVYSFFITDNFQIFIFNRWGEMVYQSNDRYFEWNGSSLTSGQPQPGGTYAYVIKYVSAYRPEKGIQEKHGGVVLLR